MKTVSFIGAGNMAFAIAGGMYKENSNIVIGVYDINDTRTDLFKSSFNTTKVFPSIEELEKGSDIIFLSVKPQVMDKVLPSLKDSSKIIVSIAAGITLDSLTEALPSASVARVMPNTPSLVSEMAAGVSFSTSVSNSDKSEILELLRSSGTALEVEDNLMDAVTGVSGSGPAFVARLIQYFIDAGIKQGLTPEVARELATSTFLGTSKLILEKNMDIEELITMVSSPGGTTIAGRKVLEESEAGLIINNTVDAAVKRSVELGAK